MKPLSAYFAEHDVQFSFILDCYSKGICSYKEARRATHAINEDLKHNIDVWFKDLEREQNPEKANLYQAKFYN